MMVVPTGVHVKAGCHNTAENSQATTKQGRSLPGSRYKGTHSPSGSLTIILISEVIERLSPPRFALLAML
jgi:hypothetical protein